MTPARARRMIGLSKAVLPLLAPYALAAAGVARAQWDAYRAARLGVTPGQLNAYSGRGGALHARIDHLARPWTPSTTTPRRTPPPRPGASPVESRPRLADLAVAVRAAEQMPAQRRRTAHRAVAAELDRIELDPAPAPGRRADSLTRPRRPAHAARAAGSAARRTAPAEGRPRPAGARRAVCLRRAPLPWAGRSAVRAARPLRGLVMAGLSTLLIAVGHVLGGGPVPDLAVLLVLFPLLTGAVVGLADRCRSLRRHSRDTRGRPVALHLLLGVLHPHPPVHAAPAAVGMLALHAVRDPRRRRAAAQRRPRGGRRPVRPAPGAAPAPLRPPRRRPAASAARRRPPPAQMRRLALAAVPTRRGPPVGC